MPDLRDLTSEQAAGRFEGTGVHLASDQLSRISEQEPPPGAPIRTGESAEARSAAWRP